MPQFNRIGVVGATGLVGQELRRLLDERYKGRVCRYFASRARPNEGVLALEENWKEIAACDLLLNATEADVAQQLRERLKSGQVLIDNSSAFRMDPEVPLIVPEVNSMLLQSGPQVIANPNCTAIILCVALQALRDWDIKRVVVSTYQAGSGAGIKGLEEYEAQVKAFPNKPKGPFEVFKFPLFENVMSHNTPVRPADEIGGGYNGEEWKVMEETRKILGVGHLQISATCMRVPVRRAHTESVTVDLKDEPSLEELQAAFAKARGVKVVDNGKLNHFPMPLEAESQDAVLVGRIRKDASLGRCVHFLCAGDQLLKGAALNALQIMDELERL